MLQAKCRGFYFDPNLVQRENLIKQQWRESTERRIENLKKNGIRKSQISLSIINPDYENKQN